jgi:serine phosphatase RsbU (regulator of sigma subunit)
MLIVGDVVGSGLPAALAMSQLRSATRALAPRCSPAELLTALDRVTVAVEGAEYSTMAVLVLDTADGTLRYSVAGHPPPLVRRAAGVVDFLEDGRSVPLGVTFGLRPEATSRLGPGGMVLLYTDGLIERRGEGIETGLQRLAQALGTADTTSEGWVDAVIRRTLAHSAQADDIAVLAVQLRQAVEGPSGASEA